MQLRFPPVRELQIDAREVFHPEIGRQHLAIRHQRFAIEACDEAQAEALLPVVESVLKILHEKNAAKSGGIARNQKSLPFPKGQQTLSVMGSFLRLASF